MGKERITRKPNHRGGQEQRVFTWQQTQLISGQAIMGESLAKLLTGLPESVTELSVLLHTTSLGYEGVLRHHFTQSGREFHVLLESPFVRAFETAPQCTDEEKQFLTNLRSLAARTEPPSEEAVSNFQNWVESRMAFMVKGFQRFVLDAGIIEPLTAEEVRRNLMAGGKAWNKRNPDKRAEFQRRATRAAAEVAQPRVFTQPVRVQMQQWFDKGLSYKEVIKLLEKIGVNTTYETLIWMVSQYDDLHYTPNERRAEAKNGFLEAVRDILEATGSRNKTRRTLEKLGYKRHKIEDAMNKLGLG